MMLSITRCFLYKILAPSMCVYICIIYVCGVGAYIYIKSVTYFFFFLGSSLFILIFRLYTVVKL